jgi:glycosyltransferase involved in cell wall biosynthesis
VVRVSRPLRLAIAGTRGVPPRYGGFETFAAELSTRLVRRGHEVTVYCRRGLYGDTGGIWQGVRRVELPAVPHKYLETVSHALLSAIHAIGSGYDAVLVCNAANAFVLPLLRAARIPAAINVDGIERKRRKWNALGQLVYLAGEALSVDFAGEVVADAQVIAAYYRERFAAETTVIPYGSSLADEPDSEVLSRLGISRRGYLLYVSRFEPENHPLEVVREYGRVETSLPLVMVGDAPYARDLVEQVRREADPRVIFTGALYGADYRTLQRNAYLYIQATEVGGTHPAMIEAMASNGAVLANGTPENREVGGEAVAYFTFEGVPSLAEALRRALAGGESLERAREASRRRAGERYDWERVVDAYEALFARLAE